MNRPQGNRRNRDRSSPLVMLRGSNGARMALVVIGQILAAAIAISASEPRVDFNRDIRPLLSDRCFACHGPDAEDRQAGLRLDEREKAVAVLESGTIPIVPGDPATSGLVGRVTNMSPDLVMPPPHVGKPITADEAALLSRWIAQGAEYLDHWAFERVERPEVPGIVRADWCRTPVDRFILARLEAEGLAPSPEADRATLVRRLSLDLLGLPPTPAEVDAFTADTAADAYERLVDRLLADERFGERMAIEWLDAARYADSHGYQTDSSRANWPWRDWVIAAFNRNLPFDRFTIHQLAGDMLDDASRDTIVATGFNRNHRINGEGGIIAEEWLVETIIDRVETTGQTWLGLTVGCARCHDHKFDPLSQREFYGLFAIFNSVPENGTIMGSQNRSGGNSDPLELLPSPEEERALAALDKATVDAEEALRTETANLNGLVAAWEASIRPLLDTAAAWQALEPVSLMSAGGATFRRIEDGSWFVEGANPPTDSYVLECLLPAGNLAGLRLEVMPDPALAGGGGFGRGGNGNIVVTRVEAEIVPAGGGERMTVPLSRAEADYEQASYPAAGVLAGKGGNGWAIDGNDPSKRESRRLAVFPEGSMVVPENARLILRIRQESRFAGHSFGRFRLAFAAGDPGLLGVTGPSIPDDVKAAIATEKGERTDAQRKTVERFYREKVDGPIRRAEAARDAARKSAQAFRDALPSAMVMKEGSPRDTFLLVRGEYDKKGDKVSAGLPAFLMRSEREEPVNRLVLARWIASRDNPLTARVWVNRQWERFFGTGIVKTSENLGSQSEFPSHPELLDWLSATFMEGAPLPPVGGQPSGQWDMKAFLKLIVTSAVYRQSSRVTRESLAVDPENRLLARFPRIRLPGEIVRDTALAASGLLVGTVGGPSVRPWMPEGVWDETSRYGDLRGYKADTGEGRYRRSLYTIWKRTAGPPTMLLFDAPNRETCMVRRSRTNTPLQALALLNETTFLEAAAGLAGRMMVEGGSETSERLSHGFRLALGRPPSDEELATLVRGHADDLARFEADPAATERFLASVLVRKPEGLRAAEFATYALSANVILNLDEFVMRE